MPAEGIACCMSVLLCRRAGEFQQRVMAVSGFGPVGQGISALFSAHPRAAEPRACQDVVPFSCGLGASARRGSIGCAQGAGGPSASRDAELCACVSQEATACVSAHGGSIAPGHGAGRKARTRVAGRVSRARAHRRKQGIRAGYAFLEMREAGGAHQHQALASVGPVSSIRVSGAALSTLTTGYAVEPQQFCGIGCAPCTTHSYAAIGL